MTMAQAADTPNMVRQVTAEDFAYSRLLSYAAYQMPSYRIGDHHRQIADKLEAVERGEITRLIITIPPRHGKSMIASEFFPAWFLGRNPHEYVIAASYGQELADDFGRKVRNQIASPEYSAIFPGVGLAEDSTSSKRFATTDGGTYFAVGVGGPVTGRGAHLLIIDDPIKNREDADSEIYRKKLKNWYTSTAYTRLMPGGRIIIIQTRWHDDDLAGWLLSDATEPWEVLTLKAIGDDGKSLWPDQYPLDVLENIQRTIGPRDWSALYQQSPSPETGDYFRSEWVRWYSEPPKGLRVYGASDYAVTDDGGDYTVHGIAGIDQDNNLYLLDWWRDRTDSAVWISALMHMARAWSPVEWAEEKGQIIKSLDPFIKKTMSEENTYFVRQQYTSAHDKPTRAQSIRGRMAQGKVYFPKTEWAQQLVSEMLRFPSGKNDDGVDVLSLFGRIIDKPAKSKAWDAPLTINTRYIV